MANNHQFDSARLQQYNCSKGTHPMSEPFRLRVLLLPVLIVRSRDQPQSEISLSVDKFRLSDFGQRRCGLGSTEALLLNLPGHRFQKVNEIQTAPALATWQPSDKLVCRANINVRA